MPQLVLRAHWRGTPPSSGVPAIGGTLGAHSAPITPLCQSPRPPLLAACLVDLFSVGSARTAAGSHLGGAGQGPRPTGACAAVLLPPPPSARGRRTPPAEACWPGLAAVLPFLHEGSCH